MTHKKSDKLPFNNYNIFYLLRLGHKTLKLQKREYLFKKLIMFQI